MLENNEGRTGRFIIQELAQPYTGTPEFQEIYRKFAKRILWIDDDVCPGAFQMNTAWYFAVPERDPIFDEHVHEYDELIGFFGSDPTDPYDLNAGAGGHAGRRDAQDHPLVADLLPQGDASYAAAHSPRGQAHLQLFHRHGPEVQRRGLQIRSRKSEHAASKETACSVC